jgi:hypothetical protein
MDSILTMVHQDTDEHGLRIFISPTARENLFETDPIVFKEALSPQAKQKNFLFYPCSFV